MAVGDIYRLAIEGTPNDVDTFVNVLHYEQTVDIPGSPDAENLIDAWLEDALPIYQAIMYTGFRFSRISVSQVTGGSEQAERSLSIFGTKASSSEQFLPFPNAAIISWRTGQAGRSKRGRTYLFPAMEEDQSASQVTAGYLALMQDIVDGWPSVTDGTLGSTFVMTIWSEVLNSGTRVTGGITRGTLGTVRRRRPGVGS